ncbi:MAG: type IX secretion system sortase PorU [Algoriphagus sp.]|nr:type IX secretion system sortase PorU [Algoriphagus sp.]
MKRQICAYFIFLGLFFGHTALSQTFRYTAGVTEAGIYTLSADQARKLGFQRLEEVAIYGYPGMLPQRLDSTQLSPQEIPSLLLANQLYFFLEGPHPHALTNQGELNYTHHLYTDTLRYALAQKITPKRIEVKTGKVDPPSTPTVWYQLLSLKEEKINVLNSGRSWYSQPIRQGQSLTISYTKSGASAPWLLYARLLSQSTSSSSFRIWADSELLREVNFSPIPTSTYGIKGTEVAIQIPFTPKGERLEQVRFSYLGAGTGHLDAALLGVPFSNANLKEGLYFNREENSISLETGFQTWEVSDFYQPKSYSQGKSAIGKKWVLFSPKNAKELLAFRAIAPKGTGPSNPELLVITVPQFKEVAQQFQAFKSNQGIPTQVVFTSEIYDWLGYGNSDITAIRNYIAKKYHQGKQLKNVLILGKGTFDYKKKLGGRPNLVPIYTSRSSLDPLTTYSSDDYYGMLNWGLGEWEETKAGDAALQVGVGRIPAISYGEAQRWLEKTIAYQSQGSTFPSRTFTFLADDGDNGVHVRDSEVHAAFLEKKLPTFRSQKLYLDRFKQSKSVGRQESPEAKKALLQALNSGTLFLNYVGHGNETTLTAEEIFKVQDLENWPTQTQLPLWFTATCEFGRHDSPFIRSAAEELLFAQKKGAIGLLATGRPVFSSVNFNINQSFTQALASAGELGADLGSIFRRTKNESLNGTYNRNFSLLGDPSLRLALPEAQIQLENLIFLPSQSPVDTIFTLVPIQLTATVQDPLTQALLTNFQGKYSLEVWDQASSLRTLGDENAPIEFMEEDQRLFVGEGEVRNGKLVALFILPEHLKTRVEQVRVRIQAWDSVVKIHASGVVTLSLASKKSATPDQTGPQITAELDGKSVQISPPIASTQVEVLLKFQDASGINSSALYPEKTMQVRINQAAPQLIHQAYRASDGNFEKGTALILLTGLKEGKNEVQVLAWDNFGNQGSLIFSLEIRNSTQLQVLSHQVYPNPATEKASLRFQHNRPLENLIATWTLFSLGGQVLFSEEKRFIQAPEILEDWEWIFLQHNTKYPAKGTYIYKLTLRSESSAQVDSVSGKLVIQ